MGQAGSVSYQARRSVEPPLLSGLSIRKYGPLTATVGSTIAYTLTVYNQSPLTLTALVVFDRLPTGAQYVAGGNLVDLNVIWSPIDTLAPGKAVSQILLVTATETITNSSYGVNSAQGIPASGQQPVVTYINEAPPSLPLIVNPGSKATWRYGGQDASIQSNPTFNPAQKLYFPLITR
jgi:uncharacterized repeat protein (TIGR01451 family)